ncbi:conserved Plasmodium protein, unknown function [Plasmodium berghei]|uniref:5-formyltetrahydrofolate cyclo-ligase n=2 Tax=Plasmodium berghei TaxID=5821 RepID=A0A509ASW1_PLABA|nr:5-formyltetrahydrofolate cyclo-ligase, putative [Plasmodium berghei ANKA]CXJ28086.1 conserved Plasmodium protein, unknown function [Plasmodium berghei]SCM27037.1 conserved Plasmodium protein, unknown function [Plasmodium berghei]SCN28763.1 conserved Plasmodium protein, unknown function [Plasmodium berghei]SCO63035.1 conserved Plasmodium protein, unknown function [Plasmodium berghei]SCO64510.1 conserved Plasmodium protein, unknown function [Plasmodium berghei]|eukprot:XP_034424409.1 5-formyltetrahydrofolate cyclo-ligase, putative [Plasmodium berghei ANKA]
MNNIVLINLKDYLNDHLKNYEHEYNNKQVKQNVRNNAKKVREIFLKTLSNEERNKGFDISEQNNAENYQHDITNEKDLFGYKDYLYTKLIRQLYLFLCSMGVNKRIINENILDEKIANTYQENCQNNFNFNKMYKYTYNYKKMENVDVIKSLKKYNINKFDEKLQFYSYNFSNKNSEKCEKDYTKTNFNICIYLPTKKEIDILFIIDILYDYFYFNLYIPITTKENKLVFFPFCFKNNIIIKHHFNIFVPYLYIYKNTYMEQKSIKFNLNSLNLITDKIFDLEFQENKTIFFIPLIAYNKYGCRVGSGKGYYDRTFTSLYKRAKINNEKKNQFIDQISNTANSYNVSETKNLKENNNNETEKNIQNMFIKKNKIIDHIKVSVSFEVFLYDVDFNEPTDIILDYIINEKNIYKFLF